MAWWLARAQREEPTLTARLLPVVARRRAVRARARAGSLLIAAALLARWRLPALLHGVVGALTDAGAALLRLERLGRGAESDQEGAACVDGAALLDASAWRRWLGSPSCGRLPPTAAAWIMERKDARVPVGPQPLVACWNALSGLQGARDDAVSAVIDALEALACNLAERCSDAGADVSLREACAAVLRLLVRVIASARAAAARDTRACRPSH